jgi:PAS domain S-box-containing protein
MVKSAVIPGPAGKLPSPAELLTAHWWTSFFEASEDAHVVCRADGRLEKINPKAARLLRLDRPRSEGKFCLFDALQAPADRKLREVFQHCQTRSDALHSVITLADGSEQGLTDLALVPLGEGYWLITFRDTARRMRLEAHVSRLVTAIDALSDALFITDAECRITFVNPAFHTVTGYGIEAVLDRTDEFLRAPSEQESIREYHDCVAKGRDWAGELVNVRADGTIYHVETAVSPVSDMAGRFIGYVACERDITGRRKLEEELRRMLLDNKMEHIGSLAAGVTQDFYRLLETIQADKDLVAKQAAQQAGLRQSLQQMSQAADRAAEVTRQLLYAGEKK